MFFKFWLNNVYWYFLVESIDIGKGEELELWRGFVLGFLLNMWNIIFWIRIFVGGVWVFGFYMRVNLDRI